MKVEKSQRKFYPTTQSMKVFFLLILTLLVTISPAKAQASNFRVGMSLKEFVIWELPIRDQLRGDFETGDKTGWQVTIHSEYSDSYGSLIFNDCDTKVDTQYAHSGFGCRLYVCSHPITMYKELGLFTEPFYDKSASYGIWLKLVRAGHYSGLDVVIADLDADSDSDIKVAGFVYYHGNIAPNSGHSHGEVIYDKFFEPVQGTWKHYFFDFESDYRTKYKREPGSLRCIFIIVYEDRIRSAFIYNDVDECEVYVDDVKGYGKNSEPGEFESWRVVYEEPGEVLYRLPLNGDIFTGLVFRWYGVANGGDINNDGIEIKCYNSNNKLSGFYRYGWKDDNQDSITGWHQMYLILPQSSSLSYIEVKVYRPDGKAWLDTNLCWVAGFEPQLENNWFILNYDPYNDTRGMSWSGYESLPRGKVWLHADGCGTSAPVESSIDYIVWKNFRKPEVPSGFSTLADIYIEVAYGGTVNAVGEGATGQGGYNVAVQCGTGQGNWINNALAFGRKQCLWHVISHDPGGLASDVLENTASGIVDIALDVVEASILSYAKFVFDAALLFHTITVDEKVAETKTAIFENVPLIDNERVYAWIRLNAIVGALGFAHSVVSFYKDGTIEGDLHNNRGIQIGGVLVHYHDGK